jgi:hypothetical protein
MKKLLVFSLTLVAVGGLVVLSAGSRGRQFASLASPSYLNAPVREHAPEFFDGVPAAAAPAAREEDRSEVMMKKQANWPSGSSSGLMGGAGSRSKLEASRGPPAPPAMAKEAPKDADAPSDEGGAAAPTRSWFPETFLFEPLVVTDAQGQASVAVKVPDRLTTWRVLGLAHSRQGGQAGAITSFLGTLPTYVEPVTPAFLYAGDKVRLPIQVVNTTAEDLSSPLLLTATGASLAALGGAVKVPAFGNVVQYAELTTRVPGQVSLRAALGETDTVEKSFAVQPAGLRSVTSKGGTLAAPREFVLTGPADTLPGTESLRLKVFPGALGLVRSELSAAPGRGGVAEDAYLLNLLGQAPELLQALGAEADAPAIRELSLLAMQRVLKHARAPSVDAATLLTLGALAHADNPVLARLGERLALQVAAAQRADGTCEGATGWTLQRLLVTTADCVHAVRASTATPQAKQRAMAVTVKAQGAFERNLKRVADGYTAAAMLASGALEGSVAKALKQLVLEHVKSVEDGSKYLEVDPGVVRADGRAPSTFEATALAVLALGDDPVVADLGTYLMSGYSAAWGWGDGRANLVALRASVQLFKEPVPAGVKITLTRDGQVLTQGTLDAAALKDVLTLDAEANGSVGAHTFRLTAEPAVAGLGYSLQLVAFTPWKTPETKGLSLTTTVPASLEVGQPADLALSAALPGNTPMQLVLPLPAGVQHDTPSLDALVSAGKVLRYETQVGQLTLHLAPQSAGSVYTATVRVVPTLAGSLQSGPASLAPEAEPWLAKAFAPSTWVIR